MFKNLFVHNILAIIYVNFRFLPFKQAIKLPIDVYGKLRVVSKSGTLQINGNIRPGMIKIGSQGRDMFPIDPVILDVRGNLSFNGSFYIGCGSTIRVEENACLRIGKQSRFGAQSLIFCEKTITVGNQVEGSWRCQIMDTDRHKIEDMNSGVILEESKPVTIGDNVWIGNSVTINKGTVIPNNTIVASVSLCNKDYSSEGEYNVLGGVPVHVLSRNKKRIWKE